MTGFKLTNALPPAIALVASLATSITASAAPYDEVVFFGDSLTDTGSMTSRSFNGNNILSPSGLPLPEHLTSNATHIIKPQIDRLVDTGTKSISQLLGPWRQIQGDGTANLLKRNAANLIPQIALYLSPRLKTELSKVVLSNIAPAVVPVVANIAADVPISTLAYAVQGVRMQPANTTNPDSTWAYHLARSLDGDNTIAWKTALDGGNNYARSGARIAEGVKVDLPRTDVLTAGSGPLYLMIPSVRSQVSAFLQRPSGPSRNGLYTVWAGANDLLVTLLTHRSQLSTPATQTGAAQRVLAISDLTAIDVARQIRRLGDAGAGTILAFNMPDIGRTPRALQSPERGRQLMSYMSSRFNDTLNSELADYRGNLALLDVHDMLDEVIAKPDRYGLRNVTQTACGKMDSLLCGRASLVAPDANRSYLFADGIHPTGFGHELIADYALSVLQAPARIGLLAEVPLAGTRSSLRVIEERLQNRENSSAVQTYGSYQHANDRQRDNGVWKPGLGNQMDLLAMGVDGGVGQHWTLGVNAAQIQHRATLGQDAGSFRLGQTQMSAYARYRLGDWSAAVVGSAGYLSYRNVSRDFSIGPARLREEGSTTGMTSALSLLTRYDWHAGIFTLTPSIGATLQNVNVRGYNESRDGGRTATSMNYREQQRRSLVSTLGLRLQADLRHGDFLWQPYGGLAWEHEFNRDTREVRAHVRNMAGSFAQTMPLASADTLLATAGLSFSNAGAWSGQVGYYGRYGGATQSQTVQATVAYRF
ncbi:autotransporter domain-containing protein [Achromobacter xylosoxidans]